MREQNLGPIAAVFANIILVLCLTGVTHAQERPLVLGIHPYLAATELHKRFSPLAEHLARELGRPVELHIESSYDSHINMVGKGEVDIAFMGPASYVKLSGHFGRVPLLAAFETRGSRTFRGVIVVRKDSQIKTLKELIGKKFAFGDVNSTMSHLVPRYMLLKAGVEMGYLGKAEFLTNHDNIALGVLTGSYDAGALKEDVYAEYESKGLRSLAISDPMPDHIFVARPGLAEDLVRKVSRVLLSLKDTENGRRVLASIQKTLTALVPVRDADYDQLRKLLASLARAGVKP